MAAFSADRIDIPCTKLAVWSYSPPVSGSTPFWYAPHARRRAALERVTWEEGHLYWYRSPLPPQSSHSGSPPSQRGQVIP